MAYSGWTVPRCSKIPFHIRVVGKQITLVIECYIKRIAEPRSNQFPIGASRIYMGNPSSVVIYRVIVTVRIFNQRKKIVNITIRNIPIAIHSRNFGKIACDYINRFFIGRQYHAVRTMLPSSFQHL